MVIKTLGLFEAFYQVILRNDKIFLPLERPGRSCLVDQLHKGHGHSLAASCYALCCKIRNRMFTSIITQQTPQECYTLFILRIRKANRNIKTPWPMTNSPVQILRLVRGCNDNQTRISCNAIQAIEQAFLSNLRIRHPGCKSAV